MAVAWTSAPAELAIHLAVERAAERPEPAPPRVSVGRPKLPVRDLESGVRFPVTCSAACEVRVQLGDEPLPGYGSIGTAALSRAGSTRLTVYPGVGLSLMPVRTVRVHVRYGAPGALHPRSRTMTLHVQPPTGPPLARIVAASAHREGDDVVVTWRTARDARRANFYAYLVERPGEPALVARAAKGGPRRFQARFAHRPTGTSVVILTGDDRRGIVRRTRVAVP